MACSKIIKESPKPLRANLSKELRELIMHMLAKKPKNLPFKLHLSHRDEYVAAAHLVHTWYIPTSKIRFNCNCLPQLRQLPRPISSETVGIPAFSRRVGCQSHLFETRWEALRVPLVYLLDIPGGCR